MLAALVPILPPVRPFAEALFSTDAGPPPPERLDWLCKDFEDFVERAGVRSRVVLSSGLAIANWVAPLTAKMVPPLGRLSIEDRCRALEATEGTPAGLPILAVKAILSLLYYEHPDALREIGVDRTCLTEGP